jgi:hypothetical protein
MDMVTTRALKLLRIFKTLFNCLQAFEILMHIFILRQNGVLGLCSMLILLSVIINSDGLRNLNF